MENKISKEISELANVMKENYDHQKLFNVALGERLPNREIIISIVDELREISFPGYFGKDNISYVSKENYAGYVLSSIYEKLFRQIRIALSYGAEEASYEELSQRAEDATTAFLRKIPEIQQLLIKDVEAGYAGDPAAKSHQEVIFSYPGLYAIFVYRYAHVLYENEIPFIPRIMTEYAHSQTGIDINPGAAIGEYFFIDHGTGIVIGETTVIGNNVKIYQGVTLGALSTRKGQELSGVKRHPTIEDNVVIYANTTILGGETVIGENAVVAGNTFVTASIPPNSKVTSMVPELEIRNKS
ncbi:MAG: serine O-acetyltransferase EpsC [Lachnospiraceae bacterium]